MMSSFVKVVTNGGCITTPNYNPYITDSLIRAELSVLQRVKQTEQLILKCMTDHFERESFLYFLAAET